MPSEVNLNFDYLAAYVSASWQCEVSFIVGHGLGILLVDATQ